MSLTSRIGAVALGLAVFATCGAARAAMTTYPVLDLSYSVPGLTQTLDATAPVTLDAATGQFLDPNVGSADASLTRYYGGTISYSPNSNVWGGYITLSFNDGNGASLFDIGKPAGAANWALRGNDLGLPGSGSLPFVLKLRDDVWNIAQIDVFLGANAAAATEGTPDLTWPGTTGSNLVITDSPLASVTLAFESESWADGASSGALNGFFSADVWTPVAAAPVPEPASLGLLALGGLALLRRR